MKIEGEGSGIENGKIRRQLGMLKVVVAALTLAWLGTTAWLTARTPALPSVLAVERLEILEPDGTPAMVLANSQRPAVATINRQVLMEGQEEDRRVPSIIFFDGKGDEVGGMLFGTIETSDGYSAVRHLSFDAYEQDQTIVLAHYQDPSGAQSGLTVSDRPTHSVLDARSQLGLEPGASREQLLAAVRALPEEGRAARIRELFGTTRAFFGSGQEGEVSLILMDGAGRRRVVIETPIEGDPSIQILDTEGETVVRLPE